MNILIVILLVLTVIGLAITVIQDFDDKSQLRKRYEHVIHESIEVNKLSREVLDNASDINNSCKDMLNLINQQDKRIDIIENIIHKRGE